MTSFGHRFWDTKWLMIYWAVFTIIGLTLLFLYFDLHKILPIYLLIFLIIVIDIIVVLFVKKIDERKEKLS